MNTLVINTIQRSIPKSSMKKKKKLQLIVEKSGPDLFGRVDINDNLIIDSASSLEELHQKMRKLILEFEETEVENFEHSYDLTSFFECHSYLNISDIARRAQINPALMRQYSAGLKFPSEERVKAIENAIHNLGKDLLQARLHKPVKESS